jgi:(p)ppGpp synthase/HD superfamily hydrolase
LNNDSGRFEEALALAVKLHHGQLRKGSRVPYISHPLAVAAIALEYGASWDEAIAAVLHDVIEDCGGPVARAEIRARFGDRVTEIVDGCTDADVTPKPPWRKRKEDYIARLPQASDSIRLVSMADKLHNSQSILRDYRRLGEQIWERFRGDREGTLWYYRALVQAYRLAGPHPLLEELDRTVTELESVARSAAPTPTGASAEEH